MRFYMRMFSRRSCAFTICFMLLLLCTGGCGSPNSDTSGPVPHKITFFAMDTAMTITAYDPVSGSDKNASSADILNTDDILISARDYAAGLENMLSVNVKSSDIYAINHSDGNEISVAEDTASLIRSALELCDRTDGALDITVYPFTRTWGFTTGVYRVPGPEEITELLSLVGYKRVRISPAESGQNFNSINVDKNMMLDLGAVAKGYTAEAIADILTRNGINSALISLGGNIKTIGHKPDGSDWNVAILAPRADDVTGSSGQDSNSGSGSTSDGSGYAGILRVSDKSVVTSGGYERYFEENGKHYCHIIDPSTGYPVDNGLLSVTIVAGDSLLCDALSTALFVMGEEKALEYWRNDPGFDFVIITGSNEILISEGIYDAFTPDPGYTETDNYNVRVIRLQ